MKFTKPVKIYLFKNKDRVDVRVKITDELTNGYRFTIQEFESIMESWKEGIEFETEWGYVFVQHKTHGPRPERQPCSYVRFSISVGNMDFHHRLSFDTMHELEKEYTYQKTNTMHWD